MLKPIFLLLQSRITTQVPAIKATQWYMGQGEPSFKGGLTTSPLAAIRFLPFETRSLGRQVQEADLQFDVFLFTDNAKGPDQERIDPEQGVKHMDLADTLNKYLRGHRASISGLGALEPGQEDLQVFDTIDRTGYETDHSAKGIFKTRQRYKCHAYDYSAIPTWQTIEATLEIESITFL